MRVFTSNILNLEITDEVLGVFGTYIQDTRKKNESGGILLGQIKNETVYLLKVTVPNIFDRSSRTSFEREKRVAQIIADYEFVNSGNKTIYVGEWHTHPEDYPTPSGPDIRMIKDQLKTSKNLEPYIFLIIQGIKGLYVAIFDGKEMIEMKELIQ